MHSNVSVHVDTTAHFLLTQYFYHMATSAINIYICPAWFCMSIRLHICHVLTLGTNILFLA